MTQNCSVDWLSFGSDPPDNQSTRVEMVLIHVILSVSLQQTLVRLRGRSCYIRPREMLLLP